MSQFQDKQCVKIHYEFQISKCTVDPCDYIALPYKTAKRGIRKVKFHVLSNTGS